ncbi:MAG TPA: right-handed parallel beta-helix repeat-containing protein [Gemmatimonadales bacterium]|nr:right-handed parallel beta-helix repeat-containing protein [Gemmatimonadales bacterium]
MIRTLVPLLVLGLAAGRVETEPCLRPLKAGTSVQGTVRVCPGRYRIPDPMERGVLVVATSGTTIDLTGVTLDSGDTLASAFVGRGVMVRNVDSVTIHGGRIRGYRFGIWVEGGRGHRIEGSDLSGQRAQALRSTRTSYDERDWLDIFHPDTFALYGSGVSLRRTSGVTVEQVTVHDGQNGIGLFETREAILRDNDVQGNTGWGIHLWRSSRNLIIRNRAGHNSRCEAAGYSRGCDAAALLLRQHSDSNFIADNDLTWSGDGFFLSGHRPLLEPSVGNIVLRNDASWAFHNAFEATFSSGNVFLENRADSSEYGFWLGYSRGTRVEHNSVVGSRVAGVAIEHGGRNALAGNTIIGGAWGIRLMAPHEGDDPSSDYLVDDNRIIRVGTGIELDRTSRARLRGNLFDEVETALTADSASADAVLDGNVFLRARNWIIDAPLLQAGGNFWNEPGADSTARRVHGKISLQPWQPASAAGY